MYGWHFQKLHELSLKIDLHTTVQYRRVAVFLGRIKMAEHTELLATWSWPTDDYAASKSTALYHMVRLREGEWEKVRKAMMGYAEKSGGQAKWKNMRIGWVQDLDTLWAVHNAEES